jgi:hypothetical protein
MAQRLAADETRHSELAWQIDAWVRTLLSPEERQQVRRARGEELTAMAAQINAPEDGELIDVAGLPPPRVAHALYRAFIARAA